MMPQFKKILFFAWILGVPAYSQEMAGAQTAGEPQNAEVTPAVPQVVQKPKKAKKKKKKKKVSKRNPSSVFNESATLVVFGENHNFEAMVQNKIQNDRELASQEQSARVIGVRRELGLNNTDSAKAPQNIIINGGTQNGFQKGMLLRVSRKIPVIDPYRENKQSELEVEFATAKIIQSSEEVSIARIQKIEGIESGLYVGTRGILIGDFVK